MKFVLKGTVTYDKVSVNSLQQYQNIIANADRPVIVITMDPEKYNSWYWYPDIAVQFAKDYGNYALIYVMKLDFEEMPQGLGYDSVYVIENGKILAGKYVVR